MNPIAIAEDTYGQKNGKISLLGNRHSVLFSYAPGESVKLLNVAQLGNLGREMAGFHNVSSQIRMGSSRWRFDFETTLFRPLGMLEFYFKDNPEDYR